MNLLIVLLVLVVTATSCSSNDELAYSKGVYVNGQQVSSIGPNDNEDTESCLPNNGRQAWAELMLTEQNSAIVKLQGKVLEVVFVDTRTGSWVIDKAVTDEKGVIPVQYSVWHNPSSDVRKEFGQAEGKVRRFKTEVEGEPCFGVVARIPLTNAKWIAIDNPLDPG